MSVDKRHDLQSAPEERHIERGKKKEILKDWKGNPPIFHPSNNPNSNTTGQSEQSIH
jgi:hypothetical protein